MDFRHTDEQQEWKDTLHRFMEREVGREYTREHDEARKFPDEVYAKAAANGWLGMLVPEDLGGVAADPVMFAIFCEAIAKFSLDTSACLMTSMFTISNIVHHGTPEQQKEHIPAFLAGERKFSISISEPQAGSDAANISTKAVLDGADWVLNGNKT
ncbi:MAG: acyl-CoA dehydrogenase family protein, partial [Sporichthyaceae bacterium]